MGLHVNTNFPTWYKISNVNWTMLTPNEEHPPSQDSLLEEGVRQYEYVTINISLRYEPTAETQDSLMKSQWLQGESALVRNSETTRKLCTRHFRNSTKCSKLLAMKCTRWSAHCWAIPCLYWPNTDLWTPYLFAVQQWTYCYKSFAQSVLLAQISDRDGLLNVGVDTCLECDVWLRSGRLGVIYLYVYLRILYCVFVWITKYADGI
jgi:hypothetical protein